MINLGLDILNFQTQSFSFVCNEEPPSNPPVPPLITASHDLAKVRWGQGCRGGDMYSSKVLVKSVRGDPLRYPDTSGSGAYITCYKFDMRNNL